MRIVTVTLPGQTVETNFRGYIQYDLGLDAYRAVVELTTLPLERDLWRTTMEKSFERKDEAYRWVEQRLDRIETSPRTTQKKYIEPSYGVQRKQ